MPIPLAVVLAGCAAWTVTHRLAPGLTARAPVHTTNYRGLSVSTGIGIAAIVGVLAAMAALWLVPITAELSPAGRASVVWPLIVAMLGFGLLGAWDDLTARSAPAGEAGHSLRELDPARGGMRVAAGLAMALVATPPAGTVSRLISAVLITLAATMVGGDEPRPGRSGKAIMVLAGVLLVLALVRRPELAPAIAALGAAVGALLPLDLRERATLGRLGGAAMGAALGVAAAGLVGSGTEVLAIIVLAGLRALTRRPRIALALTAKGPLARLDSIGRVPESSPVPVEPR